MRPGHRASLALCLKAGPSPLCLRLAKKLTFKGARKGLGLGRCPQFFSTDLRLPRATLGFFLNMPVSGIYGLSEASGVHAVCSQTDRQVWARPLRPTLPCSAAGALLVTLGLSGAKPCGTELWPRRGDLETP